MAYDLYFEPNYQKAVLYHRALKAEHPEAASEQRTGCDRKYIFLGESLALPPAQHPNSNKQLIDMFNAILMHKFVQLPVHVYPTEHFDALFENEVAVAEVTPDKYVEKYYSLFKANDHCLLTKDVTIFPCNYAYTWHLVVVEKPKHCVEEGKKCNVYLIAGHPVAPQFAIAKVITKYIEMALVSMDYKFFPENLEFHERVCPNYCSMPQILCCLNTELAFRIVEKQKDFSMFFTGIKPQIEKMKMYNYIFARYLQTLFNCFAVEHNPYGQIADFDVLMIEEEDLSWVSKTDIDRILGHDRQMRCVRPLRYFLEKHSKAESEEGMPETSDEQNIG